ncbi:MAG: LysR family transcriptional regulator [Gammaproteobacteria bacterium]|nr:LysR family transcriptional regulator [Gammaproteobacteria bacterium]
MEIASLRAFITVVEENSFSTAAEKLYLTQPAVSKRIANLEAQLGVRLFDRIGRQIHLTTEGKTLLPRAEKILHEMEDAIRSVTFHSSRVEGELTLGTSHHIGLHRLPPILKHFISRYPEVNLKLEFLDSEEVCQKVVRGKIELGVITLPQEIPTNLTAVPLWYDSLQLVTANNHSRYQQLTDNLQQLQNLPAILPARGTYTYKLIHRTLEQMGIEPVKVISVNYLETIKMLVSVGMGWSLLPRTMIDATLCEHPVPQLELHRPLGTIWHNAFTPSPAAEAMRALLEKSKS